MRAMDAGCHVFMEKPLATTVADAEAVVAKAVATGRKLVLGYILRVHPAWQKLIEIGRGLGKPLVMRMNLNQQSSGPAWAVHRQLMESLTPIVDCGVHYVDVMCQLTGARPVRVHGIGAKLSAETAVQNYGHLHVVFEDGSVGWYEAGWGPMMSEVAYFVKDVWGPKGSISIVMRQDGSTEASARPGEHQRRRRPAHQDQRAQAPPRRPRRRRQLRPARRVARHVRRARPPGLVRARAGLVPAHDPRGHRPHPSMADAVTSLRIVLAAQQSIDEARVVDL